MAAVHCFVCRVGSHVELWIEYFNIAECKEHRWPACFMVVNVTIKVLHNFITKWENLKTLCCVCYYCKTMLFGQNSVHCFAGSCCSCTHLIYISF